METKVSGRPAVSDEIQMLRLNLEVARIGEVGTPQVQRILAEILHTA